MRVRRRCQVQEPGGTGSTPKTRRSLPDFWPMRRRLDLPGGTLIYAQGEAEPRTYAVNYAGKRLSVVALDISRPLGEVLEQVRDIARRLKRSAESRFPTLQPLRALDSSLRSE